MSVSAYLEGCIVATGELLRMYKGLLVFAGCNFRMD